MFRRALRRLYLHILRGSRYKFVSFPKSGRTWLRYMVTHYVITTGNFSDDPKTADIQQLSVKHIGLPILHFTHAKANARNPFWQYRLPPFVNQHKKLIVMVRDPRDTAVSFYHQRNKRVGDFTGSISEFIRDTGLGLTKQLQFINHILALAEHPKTTALVVRYEDLKEQPAVELRRVVAFLGLPVKEDAIAAAVQAADFAKMKKQEQSGELAGGRFGVTGNTSDTSVDSFKVRKGKVGGFRDELSETDQQYARTIMEAMLPTSLRDYLNS